MKRQVKPNKIPNRAVNAPAMQIVARETRLRTQRQPFLDDMAAGMSPKDLHRKYGGTPNAIRVRLSLFGKYYPDVNTARKRALLLREGGVPGKKIYEVVDKNGVRQVVWGNKLVQQFSREFTRQLLSRISALTKDKSPNNRAEIKKLICILKKTGMKKAWIEGYTKEQIADLFGMKTKSVPKYIHRLKALDPTIEEKRRRTKAARAASTPKPKRTRPSKAGQAKTKTPENGISGNKIKVAPHKPIRPKKVREYELQSSMFVVMNGLETRTYNEMERAYIDCIYNRKLEVGETLAEVIRLTKVNNNMALAFIKFMKRTGLTEEELRRAYTENNKLANK